MGRIPKSEKIKTTQLDDQNNLKNSIREQTASINPGLVFNRNLNKEINALVVFNKNTPSNIFNSESIIYYPKEFKYWLNSQLEFSN